MAFRSQRLNKKTGTIYVYEGVSVWDKEKKQPRNKQVCIGKLDPTTNEVIPSKRLAKQQNITECTKTDVETIVNATVVGPSLVLNAIDERIELGKTLKACFPDYHEQIKLMAYYITIQGTALHRCESWCKRYAPEFSDALSSQRISEIMKTIGLNGKELFMKRWMKQISSDDYLCYDITSISSYSCANEYIKYGYNRDNEKLPQLNLAMVFGQKSQLPVYYNRLPGNITDVKTLHNLLNTLKSLEIKNCCFVMDKGFYSQGNIDDLFVNNHKFLVSVPLNNKWVKKEIDKVGAHIHGPSGYKKIDEEVIYAKTNLYSWGKKNHRCYVHVYYNAHRKAEAVDKLNARLVTCYEELTSGQLVSANQNDYDTFFFVKKTQKRGTTVTYNEEAIQKYINQYAGFQVYLSNKIKDPIQALQAYRNKDVVEKSFDDLKNSADMKRLRMHTSQTVDGRLFVQFIALIYISALRNEMRKSGLIEKYTIHELLDEMKTITKINYAGKRKPILTTLSKTQRDILSALKIDLP